MKPNAELPVAFFDSGLGGLSVLREAVRIMPQEDYIYFGDSANAPYGTKSVSEIQTLTLSHADQLYREGIKALVIACNTATSAAIAPLRRLYSDIPVIGIEPALKPAAEIEEHPRVIVMATPLTVRGKKMHELLGKYAQKADVTMIGCPGLMEFVEEGNLDGPDVTAYLKTLLLPHLDHPVDAIVLGCTHYPFLRGTIQKIVGPDIQILDGGLGTARQLRRKLQEENLLKEAGRPGHIEYRESLPEKISLCERLMNVPW